MMPPSLTGVTKVIITCPVQLYKPDLFLNMIELWKQVGCTSLKVDIHTLILLLEAQENYSRHARYFDLFSS